MAKNLIMESVFKLKALPERLKGISIAHDMTRKERDECKALVEQAKQKSEAEQGEWVYCVRGPPGRMKVVQLRKTPDGLITHKEVFNDNMFYIFTTRHLAKRGICRCRVSVRPSVCVGVSVTLRYCEKTAKRRITHWVICSYKVCLFCLLVVYTGTV